MNTTVSRLRRPAGRTRRSALRALLAWSAQARPRHTGAPDTPELCCDALAAANENGFTPQASAAPEPVALAPAASADCASATGSPCKPGNFAPELPDFTLHG
jgi:hypothetical protein